MRKISLLLIAVFVSLLTAVGQEQQKISLNATENGTFVINQKSDGLTVKTSLSAVYFSEQEAKGQNFSVLEANGLIKTYNVGMPNIPVASRLIEVPQDADVKLTVVSFDEKIINLSDYGIENKIIPAQRSVSKSEDPIDVSFEKNEKVYQTNDFFNTEIANYTEAGTMRATRLGYVQISPIQYNPVKNQVRVLNNLVIEIEFVGANQAKTEALKQKYTSTSFNNLLAGKTLNHDFSSSKELITSEPVHYVVVSDRMFETQLQEFIAWKRLKGFEVTELYTDVIGATTTEIKAELQSIYEGANPMDFVLFVGDVQQIPAWSGNAGSHVTDLRYCEYTGDDLPEVLYGRFSAQTTAQLQPQIDKSLMYEKYEMTDPSYLENFLLVAGNDEGYEDIHGNGAIWYADTYYANDGNGITAHTYLQDPPEGNEWVSEQIVMHVSDGVGFANYTAHCSEAGWADPGFVLTDLPSLTNDQKYGVWIGNCCLSNKFDVDECFGEAALRMENGGAIGDIGGSNSTYWDEDYWWGVGLGTPVEQPTYEDFGLGAYDGVFHTLANEQSDLSQWYVTQGQMVLSGNLAVEASTSDLKQYYWEIYHLMGDPSIMNYLGVPQAMTVTPSPSTLMIGMTSLTVSSTPYSYVALSQGGTLVAVSMSDASGNATLDFASDALTVGDADLVVTAQNKQPYISTISVTPANEPYLVLNSYATSSSPDFGQSITLDVTIENVAAAGSGYNTSNVSATLSTTDPYITITDDVASYGAIAAGGNATQTDAYAITIADDVPNGHVANFDLAITADEGNWDGVLQLTLNAPEISITNFYITNDDNMDGIFDPGETADIVFEITNTGDANATYDGVLSESSDPNDYLTLSGTSVSGIAIDAGNSAEFTFAGATADPATPLGSNVDVQFDANIGVQYTATTTETIIIGFIPEYCESGATNSGDSEIQEVQFGDVVNNTAGECGTYSDFTDNEDLTATFVIGSTNDIKFFLGNCDAGSYTKAGKVYIDWNYDGDFDDENEMVYESEVLNENWLTEGTFTVPETATIGQKFMRIVVSEDELNINPCGTFSWGETEDYKIYLVQPEEPIADFEAMPTTITEGETVNITDLSENYPSTWAWTITPGTAGTEYVYIDGTDENSQNPVLQFLAVGTYTVELTITNLAGNDTETKTDYITVEAISEVPVADFVASNTAIPAGNYVTFTDLSTNLPTAWAWTISPMDGVSFINATSASSQNPEVEFATPGTYTVSLVATNDIGDSPVEIKTDYITVTQELIIGEGEEEAGNYPFYNYYENNKAQIIYKADEMGSPKTLNSIAFDISCVTADEADRTFSNLAIYMQNIPEANFSGEYLDNTEATQVFFAESYTMPAETGWLNFEIDEFVYNEGENLFVEVVWGDNGFYCSSGDSYKVFSTETMEELVAYGYADSETPPNYDDSQSLRPNAKFGFNLVLDTQENTNNTQMLLYPNPTTGTVFLHLPNVYEEMQIDVTDLTGKTVLSQFGEKGNAVLDLSQLQTGVYVVRVKLADKVLNQKVILK